MLASSKSGRAWSGRGRGACRPRRRAASRAISGRRRANSPRRRGPGCPRGGCGCSPARRAGGGPPSPARCSARSSLTLLKWSMSKRIQRERALVEVWAQQTLAPRWTSRRRALLWIWVSLSKVIGPVNGLVVAELHVAAAEELEDGVADLDLIAARRGPPAHRGVADEGAGRPQIRHDEARPRPGEARVLPAHRVVGNEGDIRLVGPPTLQIVSLAERDALAQVRAVDDHQAGRSGPP